MIGRDQRQIRLIRRGAGLSLFSIIISFILLYSGVCAEFHLYGPLYVTVSDYIDYFIAGAFLIYIIFVKTRLYLITMSDKNQSRAYRYSIVYNIICVIALFCLLYCTFSPGHVDIGGAKLVWSVSAIITLFFVVMSIMLEGVIVNSLKDVEYTVRPIFALK